MPIRELLKASEVLALFQGPSTTFKSGQDTYFYRDQWNELLEKIANSTKDPSITPAKMLTNLRTFLVLQQNVYEEISRDKECVPSDEYTALGLDYLENLLTHFLKGFHDTFPDRVLTLGDFRVK
jgi:hypothetical protein